MKQKYVILVIFQYCKVEAMPNLTALQKLEIIKLIDSNVPYSEIAKKYGIAKGTITNIKKIQGELQQLQEQNSNMKSIKTIKLKESGRTIDAKVYEWFCEARARNISISGKILQEKALHISSTHGFRNFMASNGWLAKFQKRHHISSKILSGECVDMDQAAVNTWITSLKDACQGYELLCKYIYITKGLFTS